MFKILKNFACKVKASKDNGHDEGDHDVEEVAEEVPIYHDVDIRKHYDLKGLIGFPGSFGEVRVAVDLRSGKAYAVKMMKVHKYISTVIKSEIEIMKMLSHENVASIIAVYENKKKVYIVMEKYDGGDLFDLVVSKGGRFSDEAEAARMVKQILKGLLYLHQKKIAHCDVKLCNIMLTGESRVKLIDFGVSQIVKDGEMLHAEVGSPSFIAPEVLMGSYNEMCDMWSLGCVVFIMLFGFNPFNPKAIPALPNKEKICANILQGFVPEVKQGYGAFFPKSIPVSASARDFITGLLTSDWRHRLSASEALEHPWIADL
eukprot:TRINITY_DN3478_c0_g2_i1.p1 TRINITY_DN3478_c0_g2~~TRINITY_DN3478_c0_g2_i1.p1  ORF type:complete len:316 (-),score=107.38 TRINITY_DN3478_c0_g2_i1:308-1255(-)